MSRRLPLGRLIALVVLVVLALVPLFVAPFQTSMLSRMLIFALLAVSLDLLVGVTGLPSLGHASYFGVGAYTAGLVAKYWSATAPIPLIAAVVVAAFAAGATGWLAVRSHGVFFLMLTLAIGELIQQLAESWTEVTGGDNGLNAIPAVAVFGSSLGLVGYVFWYTLAFAALGFVVIWAVSRSPFGAALRGIRDNEPRMRSLGYSPFRYKLVGFVISGAVAGLAGGLLASQQFALVTPADLGFTTSALALFAVAVGGAGSLWGPALGAALVVLIRDVYGPDLDGHGTLVLGIVFIVAVYLLRNGIAGLATTRFRRQPDPTQGTPATSGASESPPDAAEKTLSALLELRGVSRSFGALKAVDAVDLDVEAGSRHALIGPNGAGKSTLFRLISGELPVSSGSVLLCGDDVTKLSQVRRAGRNLAQTMQQSSLFLTRTAAQNVVLAAQRHLGSPTSLLPRPQRHVDARVAELLASVGLSDRAGVVVSALSHGERRQLEIAVALACEPRLLLMDEPTAGMSSAESERLTELVRELPREITVVIVEHDLDVVFALAERVTVLHLGRVLLTGTPDQVRASAAVQEAYLGSSNRGELFSSAAGAATPSTQGAPDSNHSTQGRPESVSGGGRS